MRFANVLETTLRQCVLQRMTRWSPQFGAVISANYMRRYMKFSATRKIGQFLRDYRLLARSGLFMHCAYNKHYFKNHYLKSEYFAFLSLPHYLLRGERRGWRPNPFFDPVFFERRAKTRRFADYLRDPALWTHSTSDYFDACWYAKARTIPPLVDENPLHHFWHVGFDKGFSPSPRFETTFFKAAIARDERHYEKRYTFEYLCDTDQKPPLNAAELEANQRSFRNSIDLRTLKFAPSAAKKFLVFIQAGNDFVPKFVTPDTPFDILINFYDGIGNTDGVQYAFAQRGTKTTAIKTLMNSFPELFDRYEATLFLDDDIEISVRDIGALFQARAEYQLDLLQASLSAEFELLLSVPQAACRRRRPALRLGRRDHDAADFAPRVEGLRLGLRRIDQRLGGRYAAQRRGPTLLRKFDWGAWRCCRRSQEANSDEQKSAL